MNTRQQKFIKKYIMENFKRIILILTLFYFLQSCEQKKCEGFNIKKLPLKNIHFDKMMRREFDRIGKK